jgi:hypothetical protein
MRTHISKNALVVIAKMAFAFTIGFATLACDRSLGLPSVGSRRLGGIFHARKYIASAIVAVNHEHPWQRLLPQAFCTGDGNIIGISWKKTAIPSVSKARHQSDGSAIRRVLT